MTSTVPGAVDAAARDFADSVAVAEPGGSVLTYAELRGAVRAVAGALITSGIDHGDRVAIWSPNTHHWVLAALGSLYAGATVVPVNTRYTGYEALDVITRTKAKALFVAGPFLGADRLALLTEAAGGVGLPELIVSIPVEGALSDALDWAAFVSRSAGDAVVDERAATVTPDDVSDILFTSGTTGRSKGAMSAHRQALGVARAWADCGELTSADKYLIINPFFHSFGYKAGILACLLTGATMVPQLVFDAGAAMKLIETERITVLPGAPTLYVSILDHPDRVRLDLSSLRLAVTGAAVVPVALVERMRAELSFDAVLTAYGLTEAVVATMCRPDDDDQTIATTSGRAAADFEITIAADTSEILLRGPNVMLGYLNDEAATAGAIDADGWLHTGDVGQLDERGYLTITDRLKDMYICGGFNVYPAEVEQALARHPAVAESAVIGVADERLGEVGKAFVVLRPGATPTPDDLMALCRERLAGFKVPRQIEFVTDLPRNPAGKPLKRVLRLGRRAPRRRAPRQGEPMTDEDPVVLYEQRGSTALITLNRPRYRNAQNSVMTYALDAAFERAVNDDEVKVVVLAGNGDHFCAGHDIGTPGRDVHVSYDRKAVLWWDHTDKPGADARYAREMEVYLGMCRRWREIPKPSIAMVHGACIAGGLMLAWVCDLIVASDDAFFADPVVRMGIPGVEYFAHPWVLGPRFAKEALFTGDRFSAQRAYELGMVNRVVPRGELEDTTFALAGRVAAMPAFGLSLVKRAVNQCEDLMGMRPGMDSVFGLHHVAHAHNAEVGGDSLAGMDARSMKSASG